MSEEQFEPCPFCNGSIVAVTTAMMFAEPRYFVECSRCLSRGPQSLDREIAESSWNLRTKIHSRSEMRRKKIMAGKNG